MAKQNRYLEAFKESFNVVGLAGAAALSAALLNPLPLLVGLVAEAAYLVFVPDSRWYESRLDARFDADIKARRDRLKREVLPQLRPVWQARFVKLENAHAAIAARAAQDEKWQQEKSFRDVLRKLDFLLEKFLQFGAKEAQFRQYLETSRDEIRRSSMVAQAQKGQLPKPHSGPSWDAWMKDDIRQQAQQNKPPNQNSTSQSTSVPLSGEDRWIFETIGEVRAQYDHQLEAMEKQIAAAQDDYATKSLLERRYEVLVRRREHVSKMGKILTNLNHQLELLVDTFGLIGDELRTRPPEHVLADIEDVVWQTNIMTDLLAEADSLDLSLSPVA
jgi:hypothetical protein